MSRAMAMKGERPLRFALAGAANTAFGLSFYPALLWAVPLLRTHYLVALGIAQVVCLCFAYATYKLGVFRTRGNFLREFSTFSSFYLFNYAVNWAALPMLVEWGRVPPAIAQLGFNAVVIVGSYFWHSRVTFRTQGDAR
ncbi:MAG: GtrA family protein [Novosphingobium sp.]|nr:GtrA family protein [Novosphingobium sp.]